MKELLWKCLAFVVSREPIADYLIKRSQRTPYFDLEGYMLRDWLFNPYSHDPNDEKRSHDARIKWLPSIRIHHILRADTADHMHDHPWDARTIILKRGYVERRLNKDNVVETYIRQRGDTASLKYGEYHAIDSVSEGGVITMFFTWNYKGTWGFLVDGKKVQWREYEATYDR